MEIGASSACFYPLETEKSFLNIAELGIRHSEIFFNAPSELEISFLRELERIKNAYDIDVVSLHPYRSFAEGYDIFSSYKRRYEDSIEKHKKYFHAAATLGAKYIVLHGSKYKTDITQEEYADRLGELGEIAKKFSCNVAHENVVDFVGQTPEFMAYLKSQLGEDFKMVLDVKQARRSGCDPLDYIKTVGNSIVHVHLSDYDTTRDCIPPSDEGFFDFRRLFTELHKIGYNGKYIIELYSNGFQKKEEIVKSARYLEDILQQVHMGR